MPDIDYGLFESNCAINPPGGYEGATIASAATIVISKPVHKISGTAEITTITPPYTGFVGFIRLIATGAWTFNTGGNIAKALTMVANEGLMIYFDGSLWYPFISDGA